MSDTKVRYYTKGLLLCQELFFNFFTYFFTALKNRLSWQQTLPEPVLSYICLFCLILCIFVIILFVIDIAVLSLALANLGNACYLNICILINGHKLYA